MLLLRFPKLMTTHEICYLIIPASPLSNFPPKVGNLLSSKLDAELTPHRGKEQLPPLPSGED
jgi:hypothetical protein